MRTSNSCSHVCDYIEWLICNLDLEFATIEDIDFLFEQYQTYDLMRLSDD